MRYKEFKLDADTLLEINMRPKKLKQAIRGMDSLAGLEFEMAVPNVNMSITGGRMIGQNAAPTGNANWEIVSNSDAMNGDEGGEVVHRFHAESQSEAELEFNRYFRERRRNEEIWSDDFELRELGVPDSEEEPEDDDQDDFESEPDMDADESVDSIDDIRRFFSLDMNSERDVERLIEDIYQDYSEWQFEVVSDRWYDHGLSDLEEYIRHNVPANEIRGDREYDPETEDEEYTEEEFEKFVQDEWDNNGVYYDRVREYFETYQLENFDRSDEREWLRNNGVRYMSDLLESSYVSRHSITWPIWTTEDDNQSSSRRQSGNAIKDPDDINNFVSKDLQRVALDFMKGVGRTSIGVSQSYHSYGSNTIWKWDGSKWFDTKSDKKPNDIYVIEPDSSVQPMSGGAGLEFVSPPLKTLEMFDEIDKVTKWATAYGAKTGPYEKERTGLHMNISVPAYEQGYDFVKLAVLLGDEHILSEFNRLNNTYTRPAIKLITDEINRKPEKAKELLDKVSNELNLATSKIFFDQRIDKFTSIHPQSNRIEFRSPGGDWINDFKNAYSKGSNKITDTLMRVTVAMEAATDPNKYKEEYLKKLYKLLPKDEKHFGGKKDTVQLFADYYVDREQVAQSFGGGDNQDVAKDNVEFIKDKTTEFRNVLKKFVKQAQIERGTRSNEPTWKIFLRGNEQKGPWKTFNAPTLSDALDKATEYAEMWTKMDADSPYNTEKPRKITDFYIQKDDDDSRSYPLGSGMIGGDERQGLTAYQILRASDDMPVVEFMANNSAEAQERLTRYVTSGNRSRFDYYVITKRRETQTQRYEIYRISDDSPQFSNGQPIQFNAIGQEDAEEKLERYAQDFNLGAPQLFGVRRVDAQISQTPPQQENSPPVLGTDSVVTGSGINNLFIFNPSEPNRVIQALQNVTNLEASDHLEYWNRQLNLPAGTLRVRNANNSEDQNELNLSPRALEAIARIPTANWSSLNNTLNRLTSEEDPPTALTPQQREHIINLIRQEIERRNAAGTQEPLV